MPTDRILRKRHGLTWRVEGISGKDGPAPLALVSKERNALRILHMDDRTEALGVNRGMALADVRAAWPDIEIMEAEGEKDEALLSGLAGWCGRYTPLVAPDRSFPGENHGLILDITGCTHLFGGERELMRDLLVRLFHQGFAASASIAPTPGSAWALARFGRDGNTLPVLQQEELAAALAILPVSALRLADETVAALAALGLRTIGQLMANPRAPLVRRFGREPLLRLDQALGEVEEAISPLKPVAALSAERRLAEPISLMEQIAEIVLRLAGHVCASMENRDLGARLMELELYRVDGHVLHLKTGSSAPLRDPAVMLRLFAERFAALADDFDAGYGFETLRLNILQSDRLEAGNTSFLDGSNGTENAARLRDRLAARLGTQNVTIGEARDSHLPEMSEDEQPASDDGTLQAIEPVAGSGKGHMPLFSVPLRPLKLFTRPEPVEVVAAVPEGPPVRFRWRKVLHEVSRAEGPERIADIWWAKKLVRPTRDYFRIEDKDGRRYWLFREGLYDRKGEPETPRWFVHGLFA